MVHGKPSVRHRRRLSTTRVGDAIGEAAIVAGRGQADLVAMWMASSVPIAGHRRRVLAVPRRTHQRETTRLSRPGHPPACRAELTLRRSAGHRLPPSGAAGAGRWGTQPAAAGYVRQESLHAGPPVGQRTQRSGADYQAVSGRRSAGCRCAPHDGMNHNGLARAWAAAVGAAATQWVRRISRGSGACAAARDPAAAGAGAAAGSSESRASRAPSRSARTPGRGESASAWRRHHR